MYSSGAFHREEMNSRSSLAADARVPNFELPFFTTSYMQTENSWSTTMTTHLRAYWKLPGVWSLNIF